MIHPNGGFYATLYYIVKINNVRVISVDDNLNLTHKYCGFVTL